MASLQKEQRIKKYKWGLWAEKVASLYLCAKGYKILEMRYKTYVGEIDIIVSKNKTIIAVEVKARQSHEDALYAVDAKTQYRIQRALQYFLIKNTQFQNYDLRFDVITIGASFLPRHIDNAWQARP